MTIEETVLKWLTINFGDGAEVYIKDHPKLIGNIHNAVAEFAKQQSVEFFKWNTLKIDGYIKYVEQIKPLVTSHEIEEALNIFEGATIEERYNLFIQSNKQ